MSEQEYEEYLNEVEKQMEKETIDDSSYYL